MFIDKYLYEIIDEYKNTDSEEEKNEIFKSFCSSIWASENKRRTYTKVIHFNVKENLINTDVGQVFNTWSEVKYIGYKAMSKETDWISLIRQKVNNLYTKYFDKEVILQKDYIYELSTPKRLYYQWIDGIEMDANELTDIIDNAIDKAEKLKNTYQKQKMELSWSEYKQVIETFFQRIFNNCKLIDDYEDKTKLVTIIDYMNEDNFYIGYFCTYLENEIKQYQKKYYGVRSHQKYKRCKSCGKLIEKVGNKKTYCEECAREKEKERKRKIAYKYRVAK